MPNPLIEPAYLNINKKLNIFSLERIPDKEEISGSSSERSNTKHIYKYIISGSKPLSPAITVLLSF